MHTDGRFQQIAHFGHLGCEGALAANNRFQSNLAHADLLNRDQQVLQELQARVRKLRVLVRDPIVRARVLDALAQSPQRGRGVMVVVVVVVSPQLAVVSRLSLGFFGARTAFMS